MFTLIINIKSNFNTKKKMFTYYKRTLEQRAAQARRIWTAKDVVTRAVLANYTLKTKRFYQKLFNTDLLFYFFPVRSV